MPGTHGGKFGTVNGVPSIRKWSINDAQTLARAVTSATAFGTARKPGVEEWNGQFIQSAIDPVFMPGDLIAFVGYEAPDNDSYGVGEEYSGNAMIKQLAIDWNWAGGDIINYTFDFDGDLALTATPSTGPVLDASVPVIPSVIGTKWQYSTAGIAGPFTDWTNMVQANLTIMNAVQEFSNSSTYVAPHQWKGRRSGPIDLTASVVEQSVDRARFIKGQQLTLKCFVDATHYFLIAYVLVKDFTGITVDRDSGAIIQQTVALEWNCADVSDGTLGEILKPDGTTWWPVAQS